jgi:hypothetical protein
MDASMVSVGAQPSLAKSVISINAHSDCINSYGFAEFTTTRPYNVSISASQAFRVPAITDAL